MESQLQILTDGLATLPTLTERALDFAHAVEPRVARHLYILEAIGTDGARAAQHVGERLLILYFSLSDDRNIVDVTFLGDRPVHADYH